MFGHDDNQQQPAQDSNAAGTASVTDALGEDSAPISPTSAPGDTGAPTMSAPHVVTTNYSALGTDTPQTTTPTPAVSSAPAPQHAQSAGSDDLLNLKQQALQHLSPLVGQLDQTPEEKFRTTMMMIQASDDKTLVKVAFEAAQAITDDKARAQALLDIINEINYFTQHQQ